MKFVVATIIYFSCSFHKDFVLPSKVNLVYSNLTLSEG
jgi:hypothetical protein